MKKNKKENKNRNNLIMILTCFVIAVLIYVVMILTTSTNNFKNKTLQTNTNSMFTMTDLTINNSSYGDLINAVETEFGMPLKIETFNDDKTDYKTYYYDGLKLTFKNENNSYILMRVNVTKAGYKVARNLEVDQNILDVLDKFLIINDKGSYLYGNYKEKDLRTKKVKENMYFAKREKNMVYYLYMDAPYVNGYASLSDDIATLTITVSMNKVKEIEWMFAPLD